MRKFHIIGSYDWSKAVDDIIYVKPLKMFLFHKSKWNTTYA